MRETLGTRYLRRFSFGRGVSSFQQISPVVSSRCKTFREYDSTYSGSEGELRFIWEGLNVAERWVLADERAGVIPGANADEVSVSGDFEGVGGFRVIVWDGLLNYL